VPHTRDGFAATPEMHANQLSPVLPALSSFDLLGEIDSDSETPVGAAFEAEAFVESLASFERNNDNHRARVSEQLLLALWFDSMMPGRSILNVVNSKPAPIGPAHKDGTSLY
jgi:hypothetical protein